MFSSSSSSEEESSEEEESEEESEEEQVRLLIVTDRDVLACKKAINTFHYRAKILGFLSGI